MEPTKEELLEQAEQKYMAGVKLIRELCTIQSGTLNQKLYQRTLARFDTVLQGVLLYVALSDGDLEPKERQFLTGVTLYGDILTPVNSTGLRRLYRNWAPLTWDNVNENPVPKERLQEIIKETLDYEVTEFVEPMAQIDRFISTKNYIEEFRKAVPEIILAVAESDEDNPKKEESIRRGLEIFETTLALQWEHFKNRC